MDDATHARLQALLNLSPLRATTLGERAARLVFSPAFHSTTVVTVRDYPDGPSADLELAWSPNVASHLLAERGIKGFDLEDEIRSESDAHPLPLERFEALWTALQQASALPPTDHGGRDGCDVEVERMVSSDVRRVTLSSQDEETHAALGAILEELVWPAIGWTPGAYTQLQALARYFPGPRR